MGYLSSTAPPISAKLKLALLVFAICNASLMSVTEASHQGPVTAMPPIVPLLERVQEAALALYGDKNFDPKLYVDMPLKQDVNATHQAFDSMLHSGPLSAPKLERFMGEYLEEAGRDLEVHVPEDFAAEPEGFLPDLKNAELRKWAVAIHSLWPALSRRVSPKVLQTPERHTLLPLPYPFIIAGTQRFRELYFWDSFWIIKGLMVSKMYETAKAIVYNMIDLIEKYGHVLNGSRVYYINRSQPPLLSAMVREIYSRIEDVKLLKTALPALLKEHQFWHSDIHKVTIKDSKGCTHTLNRYYAKWNKPRPESGTIDKISSSNLSSASQKEQFYRNVATTAETGCDFSTRWMRNGSEFTSLSTTSILPVDLNVFILRMELDIAFMAKVIGEVDTAKQFSEAAIARKKAMNSIFWNEKEGQWFDYWLDGVTTGKVVGTQEWKASNQNRNVYASNFFPLWIELFNSDTAMVDKVTKSLQNSGLICAYGIPSTLKRSGQQWDYPNGWPHVQHILIEGLASSESKEAKLLAQKIVDRWIRTSYVAYHRTGAMHEKMDVEKCGDFGGGGEYGPQIGFGWSNGVVLSLLERFGCPQDLKINCD